MKSASATTAPIPTARVIGEVQPDGAALRGASLNVYSNTGLMRDREYAGRIEGETDAILAEWTARADAVFNTVSGGLRRKNG